jgi:L-asparaginase
MSDVEVLGQLGPDGPRLLVLYTGGTFGMAPGPDGSLVPLDLRELRVHLPVLRELPVALTVATFRDPVDSSAMGVPDWLDIADAIIDNAPGHAGVVVLHGTDTMAYTSSVLSFLLEGIDIPIVLTGAQRPVTELRSDGRENLVTAMAIAAGHLRGAPLVPEVTLFFADVLLRGNRAVKVHADSYRGFASPNHPPLATAGVSIDFASSLIRPPGSGPIRRNGGISDAVTGVRLHPGIDGHDLGAVLARPGLRGVVVEAYGAGNGPTGSWFLDPLRAAVERGVTVVVTTQCRAGSVVGGLYAASSAFTAAGAISGADMTFEAALTKLMVLTDRHGPDEVRRLIQEDLAGELTI